MNVTDPGIMQRLREETAENHKFAESRDFEQAMASGQLPQPLYVRMLEQRYLIHRELERQVQRLTEAHPYVATVIEQQLLQEPNLQADLEFFGIDVDAVKPCEATRTLIGHIQEAAERRPLSLLGFFYVFEGSKNGARIISRFVRQAYGLNGSDGTRYLDPHGEEQRALWMAFRQRMDAAPIPAADRDAIVEAAKVTFDCVAAAGDELMAQHAARADSGCCPFDR